ncbi:MAG: hypothetical protein ACC631_09230 [Halocynthiibacter sp.]
MRLKAGISPRSTASNRDITVPARSPRRDQHMQPFSVRGAVWTEDETSQGSTQTSPNLLTTDTVCKSHQVCVMVDATTMIPATGVLTAVQRPPRHMIIARPKLIAIIGPSPSQVSPARQKRRFCPATTQGRLARSS